MPYFSYIILSVRYPICRIGVHMYTFTAVPVYFKNPLYQYTNNGRRSSTQKCCSKDHLLSKTFVNFILFFRQLRLVTRVLNCYRQQKWDYRIQFHRKLLFFFYPSAILIFRSFPANCAQYVTFCFLIGSSLLQAFQYRLLHFC